MLVSDVITAAYREADLIPVGSAPTGVEQTEALGILNRNWRYVLGFELGESVKDWPIPQPSGQVTTADDNFYPGSLATSWINPPQNVNLLVQSTEATLTILFTQNPSPGARMAVRDTGSSAGALLVLNGNSKLIEGQPVSPAALVSSYSGKEWFYRDDLGDWALVADMTLTGQTPLPSGFDDFFILMLARRLSARNSQQQAQLLDEYYTRLLVRLQARYTQVTGVGIANPLVSQTQQAYAQTTYWDWP